MFENSDPVLLLIFLILFINCLIAQSFLIRLLRYLKFCIYKTYLHICSVFFSKSILGLLFGFLLWFVAFIPYFFIANRYERLDMYVVQIIPKHFVTIMVQWCEDTCLFLVKHLYGIGSQCVVHARDQGGGSSRIQCWQRLVTGRQLQLGRRVWHANFGFHHLHVNSVVSCNARLKESNYERMVLGILMLCSLESTVFLNHFISSLRHLTGWVSQLVEKNHLQLVQAWRLVT